jgi:DNA-binding NtrC family response regulator
VRRVGENVPVYVNVRVLAAANEPLEKKIKDGSFREDLYYRLNVIAIQLPGLRERRDDIPLLVGHFLKDKTNPQTNRPFQMTRQAMEVMCAYDWPGNVRELENAVERAATLCEGDIIQASDLPPSILGSIQLQGVGKDSESAVALPNVPDSACYPLRGPDTGEPSTPGSTPAPMEQVLPLKTFMREQEQAHLNRVLQHCGGDKEQAAILLGVSLATLYRKLSGEEKDV